MTPFLGCSMFPLIRHTTDPTCLLIMSWTYVGLVADPEVLTPVAVGINLHKHPISIAVMAIQGRDILDRERFICHIPERIEAFLVLITPFRERGTQIDRKPD